MPKMYNLKALRKARGMTQTQLALAAGIPQSVICKWETTARQHFYAPTISVARVLGVMPHELFLHPSTTP